MTTVNVQFVKQSSNSKTGKIPVTNSDRGTCPDSCALKNNGCYASAGYYTRLNWDKVTAGERGGNWSQLCDSVAKIKPASIWRHNVSGDLPQSCGGTIDAGMVNQLAAANTGRRGFTYTHHDMTLPGNLGVVRDANKAGFIINLSADNPTAADDLKKHGLPVVSIVAENQLSNFTTAGGNKVVICPAVVRDDITCKTCKMCAVKDRKTIIGFPVHGTQKSKIEV